MKLCANCNAPLRGRQKRFCSEPCRCAVFVAENRRFGPDNPRFNGGLSESDGRTIITCRDYTWIPYSEGIVMAYHGHEMQPGEIVHHRNGDPTDDRPENLQVLTRAEHAAVHRAELNAAKRAALERKKHNSRNRIVRKALEA